MRDHGHDGRQMTEKDWKATLRERFAAEGLAPSAHREAIDEIADHLNDLYRSALRDGMSDAQAGAAVEAELARMGPLALAVGERARRKTPTEVRWGSGLVTDARHAIRSLRVNRGFSAVAILTLALGIGACTTVFSIVNALLLGSLPYPHPEQLVLLWESEANNRDRRFIVAQPTYEDWRRDTRSFSSLGIWEYRTFNVASAQEPEQVRGVRATTSLFTVLGIPPALGRVFTEEEEKPGHRVVVISDGVWRAHLGASPSAIGSSLRLNGEPYEVIGVMPRGFAFPNNLNGVWVPFAIQERDRQRGAHSFQVAGRMKPGVEFEQARADVEQVGRSLQRYEESRDEGSTMTLMSEQGLGLVRPMLTALMGAVALVLLIGCVNVANLQMGRALSRRREFAMRLALGAGVGRIARQLLTESLVLAGAGAIAGVILAWAATRTADLVLTPGFRMLPFRGEVPLAIDARVLLFAAVTAIVCAALFGFAPLIGLGRHNPQEMLRDGDRSSTAIAGIARRALVALEVALAIVVLCGAGLLIKSLTSLMQVQPGFDPADVLTLQVSLPQENTYGPPARSSWCADLSRGAEGLPGILRLGAISHLPLSGASAGRALTVEGYAPQADEDVNGAYRLTCPGYFAALGIPIIEGRDFNHRDVTNGARVAIINRAMARKYWTQGESPVGRRLKIGGPGSENPWNVIVGVAEDVRHFGLDAAPSREIYLPYSQAAWPVMTVVAKTVGDPMTWQHALRETIKRVDPDLPVAEVRSMESVVGSSTDWRQTPMRLLTGFAIIGLLLASIGVYGVLAYYVSQRTREIGVRAALGATRRQLAGMVVSQSLWPMGAGVVAGIAGSLASGRLLQQFLFEVEPGDPQVIATIVVLLTGVGLLASWLPARRAAAIDPLVALRDE
jgi:putative ABC transport system permease protein